MTIPGKSMMFRRIALLVAVFCISGPVMAVGAGDMGPAFTGKDEAGGDVSFPAVIDGKPTIIVFWATWCSYCKAFMPYLADIQKDYGEDKINVLLINHKERGAGDPTAYINGLDFPVTAVMDGDAIGDAYAIDFIPGMLIADIQGRIAWRRKSTDLPAGKEIGEFWNMKVREQLDSML